MIFYERLYNGCILDDIDYVYETFSSLLDSLSMTSNLSNLINYEIAQQFIWKYLIEIEKESAKKLKLVIEKDISQIIKSKSLIIEGLFRAYDLIEIKKVDYLKNESKVLHQKFEIQLNKMVFFLSFVKYKFNGLKRKEQNDYGM